MWLYANLSSSFDLLYLRLICNFYEVGSEVNLVTLFCTFPLSQFRVPWVPQFQTSDSETDFKLRSIVKSSFAFRFCQVWLSKLRSDSFSFFRRRAWWTFNNSMLNGCPRFLRSFATQSYKSLYIAMPSSDQPTPLPFACALPFCCERLTRDSVNFGFCLEHEGDKLMFKIAKHENTTLCQHSPAS